MSSKNITAVVITKNEASNIARCLASLSWASEILVYDSGSSDNTVQIAKKMGAKVVEDEWLGFGPTKHKASALAENDWIFSIDADEVCPPQLAVALMRMGLTSPTHIAYAVPRISFYLNRWIKHGGWYPDRQVRLFNRTKSQWDQAVIHEKIVAEQILNLNENLQHYVFKDIAHQVETNNRYSTLQAESMLKDGKSFSWFHFLTKPYVKFIECYFWKRGFLDGWAGYVIARSAAYSVFLKWSKLKELKTNEK